MCEEKRRRGEREECNELTMLTMMARIIQCTFNYGMRDLEEVTSMASLLRLVHR